MKHTFQLSIKPTDQPNEKSIYCLEQQWGETTPDAENYIIGTFWLSVCNFILMFHPKKSAVIHSNVFTQINALELVWDKFTKNLDKVSEIKVILGGGLKSELDSIQQSNALYAFFSNKGCLLNDDLLFKHPYGSFAIDARNGDIIVSNHKICHDTAELDKQIKNLDLFFSNRDSKSNRNEYGEGLIQTIENGQKIKELTNDHFAYVKTPKDRKMDLKIPQPFLKQENPEYLKIILNGTREDRMRALGSSFLSSK